METKKLEELGLTKGEANVYLALIELGETTTTGIISKIKMQKSTVYFCLEKLLSMGLASYIIKNNKKYFKAAPPDRLIELLEEKEKKIEKQKKKIKEMIPGILALEKEEKKPQDVRFFTGWNGMKSAFDDMLRSVEKGDEVHVFGVNTVPQVFPRFRRFIKKFHQKREENGVKLWIIINDDLRNSIGKDRKGEKYANVRFIPKEFVTPTAINIYGNKTLIAIWTENPAAVVIDNKETADSFRHYFRLIWNIAKK